MDDLFNKSYKDVLGSNDLFHVEHLMGGLSKNRISLQPQRTTYNCGPASVCTILELLGAHHHEMNISTELGAAPLRGTENKSLLEWTAKNLPVKSYGENSYRGGLAIANIINPFGKQGHYVVLLGIKDSIVRYYCPRIEAIITCELEQLEWKSGDGIYKNWSINIESSHDFWEYSFVVSRRETLITT
ncbi:MAG TPA: hypothetical protein PKI93_04550 [Alphaproteobacteria bacterium]|nr:hypothetical protein [Alphaproteobacteria bacterium]HNS44643.1 hypothetical protein [Alphaproteobacteria bacterium]